MVSEQFRDGKKIREGSIEVWEFDQQGNPPIVQTPFEIAAGDSFRTTCFYRDNGTTEFGLGSQEEMCIAFLYYYPRKLYANELPWFCGYDLGFPSCDAEYKYTLLEAEEDLERVFGVSDGKCPELTDPDIAADTAPKATPAPSPAITDDTTTSSGVHGSIPASGPFLATVLLFLANTVL